MYPPPRNEREEELEREIARDKNNDEKELATGRGRQNERWPCGSPANAGRRDDSEAEEGKRTASRKEGLPIFFSLHITLLH